MPKKPKGDAPPAPASPSPLKHNPFAALRGAPAAEATPAAAAVAPTAPTLAPAEPAPRGVVDAKKKGRVVLRRETKHRGGKAVIIVTGFGALPSHDEAAVEALAQRLKKQLGCGGTVEREAGDTQIVLQGDRAAQVAELLRGLGYRVDGVTR
ncbi:MAG: translation initiation factor [Polyangiales bacterium]